MESDREHCHRCNAETNWKPNRSGTALKCEGCGDRFPCAGSCGHFDCQQERGIENPELPTPSKRKPAKASKPKAKKLTVTQLMMELSG